MKFTSLLFSFKGRIGRAAWWLGTVAVWALDFAANAIADLASPPPVLPDPATQTMSQVLADNAQAGIAHGEHAAWLLIPYLLCLYVGLAVGAKRCHDRNRSAWFLLLLLIPVLGWIWLIVELGFLAGSSGPNRFGTGLNGSAEPTDERRLDADA
jgi:uncharacterized membrane protein YhaH (DUF805 family)